MVPECEKSSATTYYWYREALDISNSISEGGGLNWKMTVCLLVAWAMVCLAMIKGIQSSGKASRIWFSVSFRSSFCSPYSCTTSQGKKVFLQVGNGAEEETACERKRGRVQRKWLPTAALKSWQLGLYNYSNITLVTWKNGYDDGNKRLLLAECFGKSSHTYLAPFKVEVYRVQTELMPGLKTLLSDYCNMT